MSWSALAGLLAALLACAAGCGDPPPPGRVLLVGIDGATLRVAGPMLREGRLPHLAVLARDGFHGPLHAHRPLDSPRIWTSIATGKMPRKHGILGFARNAPDGTPHLYNGADRRTHAIWNIASREGLTVAVVNWWNTYPPERINGFVASDHLLPMEVEGRENLTGAEVAEGRPIVFPPEWMPRVKRILEDRTPLTDVPDPFLEDPDAFAPWVRPQRLTPRYWNDNAVTRVALEAEREIRPDLMLVFLAGIDRVSHILWAGMEPPSVYPEGMRMTPSQKEAAARALRDYYAYTDALIGRLLERYGPDDLVMVVSDHGFEAGRGLMFLSGVHESPRAQDGVIFTRGPGIRHPATPTRVSVNDVTPTILTWLGLPVGRDMDGSAAAFLEAPQPRYVATWDTEPIERLADAPSGAEQEIIEELEALGYLDHDDGS
jgi:predicted AlkP superfamily phosphohydrolase/phosphomutase